MTPTEVERIVEGETVLTWSASTRVATVRFGPRASLTLHEGRLLVGSLERWVGAPGSAFGLIADVEGVRGADAEYRSFTTTFFRQYSSDVNVAVINVGPVIRVIADLFRLATGLSLKAFADEAAARQWLRSKGLDA